MEYKDYYKTMGLERSASQEEVQRAHRKLSRKFHPDVSKEPNAEAQFKDVGEAYKVLKDPEKRAAYDQLGSGMRAGQEFHAPPDWNQGFEHAGRGFTEAEAQQQSDFFESLFGHRARAGRTGSSSGFSENGMHFAGEDRHASIQIDLEDAYAGATRKIVLRVPEANLQGQVSLKEHQIEFVVPKGIRAGQRIRLAGQGAPGIGEGAPGDLYLEVEFKVHAHYRVEQHDVYLDLPVAPWEAALGTEIEVPTPSGVVELKIPAGSIAGKKLRLKGRGIPGAKASTPAGDFYFVLQIAVPAADSDEQRAAYQNMANVFSPFKPRTHLGATL